jgi:ankyrin repeat protein
MQSKDTEKHKRVGIFGAKHEIPKELIELYEKDGYKRLGDGKKYTQDIDLSVLEDRIGPDTRIDICVHGLVTSDGHFIEDGIQTKEFLTKLAKYSNGAMHIHLHSCFAGFASSASKVLPVGSTFVCHGDAMPTVVPNDFKAIFNANKQAYSADPMEDLANNFFLNSKHSAFISHNLDESRAFKFRTLPKFIEDHPEVLSKIDDVLKYFNEKRNEFIKEYNAVATKKLDVTRVKELSKEDAGEWANDYFKYLVLNGNLTLTKALKQHPSKFQSLINNKDPEGRNSLIYAVVQDHEDLVEEMIKAGANLNEPDNTGMTALISAVKSGNTTIVKKIIENGADISIADNDGKSAYDHADNEIKEMLTAKVKEDLNNQIDKGLKKALKDFKENHDLVAALKALESTGLINSQDPKTEMLFKENYSIPQKSMLNAARDFFDILNHYRRLPVGSSST